MDKDLDTKLNNPSLDPDLRQDDSLFTKPEITIIMLTYNRARYIPIAIQSIFDQNFENWELLIIDDGSIDNTEAVIAGFLKDSRLQYIKRAEHFGIAKNRNFGLKIARGDYIAVLDSDDVWINESKLQKQFDFLRNHSDHVLLGVNFERIDENGKSISKVSCVLRDEDIRENILLRNEFIHSGILFKRAAALSSKGYDESLFIWEDYDLWLKLGKIGKFANLPECMVSYRVHPSSVSAKKRIKGGQIMLKIIRRYKKSYPNFYKAYIKALLRIVARAIGL